MEAKGSGTVLSELELAIETVAKYYNKYSSKESFVCRKEGIKKKKFREMLEKELSHMLTETRNKEKVKMVFQNLDQDGDGVIDFNEYWGLIGSIVKPIARDNQ